MNLAFGVVGGISWKPSQDSATSLHATHGDDALSDQPVQFAAQADFREHTGGIRSGSGRRSTDRHRRARQLHARRGRGDGPETLVIAGNGEATRHNQRIGHQLDQAGDDAVGTDAGCVQCFYPRRHVAASHPLLQRVLQIRTTATSEVGKVGAVRKLARACREKEPPVARLVKTIQRAGARSFLAVRFIPLLALVILQQPRLQDRCRVSQRTVHELPSPVRRRCSKASATA